MAEGRGRGDEPPPSVDGGERDVLLGFLNYLRGSVIDKVRGAPEPQVREPGVPSGTNLLGLLNHLTNVERFTFLGERIVDWKSTFDASSDDTVDSLIVEYRDVIARADDVVLGYSDLSTPGPRRARDDAPPSMRWALVHMIEETGRHAGHMDILRELIDGATGR